VSILFEAQASRKILFFDEETVYNVSLFGPFIDFAKIMDIINSPDWRERGGLSQVFARLSLILRGRSGVALLSPRRTTTAR
jgi:hypothetical protein